jgi:hypothetical protein
MSATPAPLGRLGVAGVILAAGLALSPSTSPRSAPLNPFYRSAAGRLRLGRRRRRRPLRRPRLVAGLNRRRALLRPCLKASAIGAVTLANCRGRHDIWPMSLPPGFLDELRGRLSLAQVVGRKVTWDQRKSNATRGDFWAPCPFHQEKTASFHVDEPKGYYYCFGCHAKGDAISFLRETEAMGFMEAVEALAAEAGMALPERGAGARQVEGRAPGSTPRWRPPSPSTA